MVWVHGMLRCAKIDYCTHTHTTCDLIPMGFAVPMTNTTNNHAIQHRFVNNIYRDRKLLVRVDTRYVVCPFFDPPLHKSNTRVSLQGALVLGMGACMGCLVLFDMLVYTVHSFSCRWSSQSISLHSLLKVLIQIPLVHCVILVCSLC
jgi:hypothetical protein